jgi:hypothetical protein
MNRILQDTKGVVGHKPTPEVFQTVHGMDSDRKPIFSLLLKRTYDIRDDGILVRSSNTELRQIDEYYDGGDPEWATVKFEADFVPFKPLTDVVVIATAYAPQGRAVQQMDVGINVAGKTKAIRVLGDRECHYNPERPPSFSDPIPFESMPIRYERAYGGRDDTSDPQMPIAYPRNDMGCGLALKNNREKIQGMQLPNLEDPLDLLMPDRIVLEDPYRWNSLPLPQGLGWVQRSWYPRSSFVGSMPPYLDPDEVMREEALGMVPKRQVALSRQFKLPSFHPRFNNGASQGLMFPPLAGTESVRLVGLTSSGLLDFALPGERPRLMLDIGIGENELDPVLHTVCIRPDDMQVDLVWRGAHPYPGLDWLPQMKSLHAEVA